MDSNNTSDPFLEVTFPAGLEVEPKSQKTVTINRSLSPVWDHMMRFNWKLDSGYQLASATMQIDVWDKDVFGSDLIGTHTVDLAFVWNQPYHELYQRWVALTVDGSSEINGYAKLSISIVGENQTLRSYHELMADTSEVDRVLFPPSVNLVRCSNLCARSTVLLFCDSMPSNCASYPGGAETACPGSTCGRSTGDGLGHIRGRSSRSLPCRGMRNLHRS
eukprot:SAG31_NODE_94_length_26208_cov_6.281091_10_plen_219_part_00